MIPVLPQGGLTDVSKTKPVVDLGDCWMNARTNELWVYLKAQADLTKGEVLSSHFQIKTLTDVGVTAAGTREISKAGESFLTDFANIERESQNLEHLVGAVYGGAGRGQNFLVSNIKSDTELEVFWYDGDDDGGLATALDATSDLRFSAPWRAIKAIRHTPVIGVCQFDVEAHHYFWAKVRGVGLVKIVGGVEEGRPLRVHATTAGAADDIITLSDVDYPPFAYAVIETTASGTYWANIDCTLGLTSVPEIPASAYRQAHRFPTT